MTGPFVPGVCVEREMGAGGQPVHPPCGDGDAALLLSRMVLPEPGRVLTADLSPENMHWIAARYPGLPVEAMPRSALLEEAVSGLARRRPHLSARQVVTNAQLAVMLWSVLLSAIALAIAPLSVLCAAIALLSLVFVAGGMFRALLALYGGKTRSAPPPSRLSLPVYTILAPLYREASVLPSLAAALARLDYPRDRLDILLVVEADDTETLAAACALPDVTVIAVPPGGPRTKPKAASYALQFARGDYLVVYDAEDRPEPDQLLKAVAMFRVSPRPVACLQARLNFYNAQRNWLTNGIMAQVPQAA